jgi:hypothetical protein
MRLLRTAERLASPLLPLVAQHRPQSSPSPPQR